MMAAWYEKQGPARDVLTVGEMPDPHPGDGEVRIPIAASGINPGDIKKRQDAFGYGMPYPRVIPHSDGAGHVDEIGDGVSPEWLGQRVWCYGAQSYRPFGAAAEYAVVPWIKLPGSLRMCRWIRAHVSEYLASRHTERSKWLGSWKDGPFWFKGRRGRSAFARFSLARRAGAHVIGTVRSSAATAAKAGAHQVVHNDSALVRSVRALAPEGIDHIVEVAFAANIEADVDLLKMGGSIASYATDRETPQIQFWPMVFKNIRLLFLGSDDFSKEAKMSAAADLNGALETGWTGFEIAERIPLAEIARAHELAEHPVRRGRIVVVV